MGDDALTRKTETAGRFNRMATDFDQQGAFAHFGQRLVEVVGMEPEQRVLDMAANCTGARPKAPVSLPCCFPLSNASL
ncbi:MAG TPA: hypothetical protein VFH48_27790 [Chloroflexota bacterium]|nr:hypothetical protein [Chloroflexota bacterium]